MRELDVPASCPAFHAPGRVLALCYCGEISRGRLLARREGFEGGKQRLRFTNSESMPKKCTQTRSKCSHSSSAPGDRACGNSILDPGSHKGQQQRYAEHDSTMDAAGSTADTSAALLEDYDAANVRPWPHQLDAIRAVQQTKNKRCLVQHAAGSGKSLTIAGLAASLADDGFRVVVICDRRQLDAQIYATVRRVCQRRHGVGRAASVADLASSTETVLCTTLQKVSRAFV